MLLMLQAMVTFFHLVQSALYLGFFSNLSVVLSLEDRVSSVAYHNSPTRLNYLAAMKTSSLSCERVSPTERDLLLSKSSIVRAELIFLCCVLLFSAASVPATCFPTI